MLEQNTKKRFEEYAKFKTIIVIGAGKLGRDFMKEYGQLYPGCIVLCDNDEMKQQKRIYVDDEKYRVYPVEKVGEYLNRDVIIVIASKYYSEIYRQILSLGGELLPVFVYPFILDRKVMLEKQVRQCLSDYYYYNHMDLSKRNEFIDREYGMLQEKNQLVIPYLPVYLTTRCTLCCEKCNNLMPYFKNRNYDFDVSKIMSSITRILACVQELTFCELVGGEPFLYKDLDEILDFVGQQKKIRQIVIVTNGTIMPSEQILEKLKKYNVLVRISDYGMFEKMAKLVIALEAHDINVRVLQDMKWNDPGGIEKRGRSENERKFQYNKCIFSLRCKYLTEDKLFTCARIASLYLLEKYNGGNDILAIDDLLTEEKLRNFYLHDTGDGCDYCDLCSIDSGEEISAAVQVGTRQIKRSEYTIIRNDYFQSLKRG